MAASGNGEGSGYYGSGFERLDSRVKIRKVSRKRALQNRLETSGTPSSSPSKRPCDRENRDGIRSTVFIPGEDEDSLMSLFYGNPNPLPAPSAAPPSSLITALQLSSSAPPPSPSSVRRQALTPAPPHLTPSPSRQPAKKRLNRESTSARKLFALATSIKEEEPTVTWRPSLPLDWSLKTKVTFTSLGQPFPWRNVLGAAEESTGTSAFVRCAPEDSGLLDTSWGARLRSATLYWTHPALPNASPLFPPGIHGRELDGIRLEERITDSLWDEWTESFRSLFHLVRSRQAPFFYATPPGQGGLTLFFSAAGTQGLPHLQVYVTPSSKGFRDALTQEGIDFTMPYYVQQESGNDSTGGQKLEDLESEEEDPEDWMDEMGITSSLSISAISKSGGKPNIIEEKKKSSLLLVVGTQAALLLFNFLINSKAFLVPGSGPYKGIPPTLLSPVAFVGASLKALQVRHSKTRISGGNKTSGNDPAAVQTKHSLEITGPTLPSALLDLTTLLAPAIPDFTMTAEVCMATANFNVSQEDSQHQRGITETGAAAFELQNLSDCGLKRSHLEHFCTSPSVSAPYTALRHVVAHNGAFNINPHISNRLITQRTKPNILPAHL